jgi:hypothetical protein
MRLSLTLPLHHERLVVEWIVVKEIEIFRSFRFDNFGTTSMAARWVTLHEMTDALTK